MLKKTFLNVKQLIEATISENEGMASSFNVKLVLGDVDKKATILGDRDKLQQVLNNLLSNAIKYSPKGDKVTVNATQSKQVVTVEVCDNGTGIPEDFHASIFEKFSQADSSTTRKKGGTGLGLSIAKAIVEKHKGEIGFTTDKSGTNFYFKLASSKRSSQSKPEVKASSELQGKILICEDDEDIATLIAQKLATTGCNCEITHSAEEALSLISQNDFSVLLLDLALPGMSGMTLINKLKARADTKDLPIIVVSAAAADVQNSPDGQDLDVAAWVQKPFDDSALANALNPFLNISSNEMAQVLYVEDDESLARIFIEMLKSTAHVHVENSVEGAKSVIHSTKFDLVVLDLQLIDGSGLELIPVINQLPNPIPILVFSANDLPPEYEKSVTASFVKAASSHDQFVGAIKLQLQLKSPK